MIAKKHEFNNHTILAVCDKELLGKTISSEKIELTVSQRFYGGDEITQKELLKLVNESDSLNLVGNKCIEILQKKGLISESSIINISDIKHAQIYKI